ncbi:MAG: hypothetical protein H7A21_18035 [Spirochaetales bacterium]|nr:hypothetical protein [Leptospiraceae bacterium]MCP5483341.1 hypothetical protein [Spirochaetales bacterium]MCP5484130.1 hypothetical protein [Spirochaetales bacterium]
MRAFHCVVLVSFLGSAGLGAESVEFGTPARPDFTGVRLQGTELFRGTDATRDIRLQPRSAHMANNLLYLDFDQELPHLLRDAAGRYQVLQANYIVSPEGRARRAALFSRLENRVEIASPEELWPGLLPLNDFTIEMSIRPIFFYRRNVIFQKTTLLDGEKRGLEIYIEGEHVIVSCWQLFEGSDGVRHTVQLRSHTSLKPNEWVQIRLSFEAARGRLALFLDGQESHVVRAGDSGGVWQAHFHPLDRSPMILAESYAGLLDEFRILGRASGEGGNTQYAAAQIDNDRLAGHQQSGVVLSEVMPGPDRFGAVHAHLAYEGEEPDASMLNVWVRTSNAPFSTDTRESELAWRRVPVAGMDLGDFRYLQWKAELKSDPGGNYSPILKSLRLTYESMRAPTTPRELRVVEGLTDPDQVGLEWVRSPEREIDEHGGYFVYIGLRSGEYAGRIQYVVRDGRAVPIRFEGLERLPLSTAEAMEQRLRPEVIRRLLDNRVRLVVTNELIQQNIALDPRRRLLPFLRAGEVLYFAVSAYNGRGGESELSEEVFARLRPR